MTNEELMKKEFEKLAIGIYEMLVSAKTVGKTRAEVLRDYARVSSNGYVNPDLQKKTMELIKEIMDIMDY